MGGRLRRGQPLQARPLPDALAVTLPEFGETLRPTFAVEDLHRGNGEPDWALLVDVLPGEMPFDDAGPEEGRRWHASPQVRLERLLRETGVPAGLLFNGGALRLVYAPRARVLGITSRGRSTPSARCRADRCSSALCMLLGRFRLFAAPKNQSLLHILRESRKYQNVVSTKLAGQVLEALNELLRGFQAANEAAKGRLLDEIVREDPGHVYGGLLAVLLRLVFLLYAEDRGLMSTDPVYVGHYSLTGLFEKLRDDAGRFPDTMDQRYGAWSRLLRPLPPHLRRRRSTAPSSSRRGGATSSTRTRGRSSRGARALADAKSAAAWTCRRSRTGPCTASSTSS